MTNIVFKNDDFVVCDKKAQVLSVPSREKADVRPCLGVQLQKFLGAPVFCVQPLDFEVSGLTLYALNSVTFKIAQRWFGKKEIQKTYRAITSQQNFMHWPAGISTDRREISTDLNQVFLWKTRLLQGKRRCFESDQGDWAETKAIMVLAADEHIQWDLIPRSGLAHQLRFELSRHGFPIQGDELYGSKIKNTSAGIALRVYKIDMLQIKDRLGLPQKIEISEELI